MDSTRRARSGYRLRRASSFANLGVQAFSIDNRLRGLFSVVAEDANCAVEQLIFPLLDLVRMHVELLGELDHCLFALNRGECDFRLRAPNKT